MGIDKKQGRFDLSRRDFLKVSAAGAAAAAIDWAPAPAMANIAVSSPDTATVEHTTTCPYCSAQCGQRVKVGNVTGRVYDIYGDWESPTSNGGLCSKGAGSFQLVNNQRRLGVDGWNAGDATKDQTFATWTYPDATKGRDSFNWVAEVDNTGTGGLDLSSGVAYWRTGNGNWQRIGLDAALDDIANKMVTYRNAHTASWPATYAAGSNASAVQFLGSSHLNNEQNYLYRKLIANFGTSRVEHQARI